MYCPLCKAEYRLGPDLCSDCLVSLVHTREQADASRAILLWQGTRQAEFNNIVAALKDSNIPNYARSGLEPETGLPWWAFTGIFGLLTRVRQAREQWSWQVFVLESDFANAEAVIRNQKPN
jgi:hypothetical protein